MFTQTHSVETLVFLIFGILFFIMIAWEVFEWSAGLFNPPTFVFDVSKDLFFGLIGGLLAYVTALRLRM
jgi:hypothetical protein